MYAKRDFSPMDPTESLVLGLNFVNDLDVTDGEFITAIVGGQWAVTVAGSSSGTDPTPTARAIGSAAIVVPAGATTAIAVTQRIANLIADVTYTVQSVVITNLGNTFSLYSHVFCEPVE